MALRSFIEIASDSHFPLENLPFGVFKPRDGSARIGVALGDHVVDLSVLEEAGHFKGLADRQLFAHDSLNEFLALGRPAWRKVREILQKLLSAETTTLRDNKKLRERVLHRQSDIVMQLPVKIGTTRTVILHTITPTMSARCCAARRTRSCQIGNGCRWRITGAPARSL